MDNTINTDEFEKRAIKTGKKAFARVRNKSPAINMLGLRDKAKEFIGEYVDFMNEIDAQSKIDHDNTGRMWQGLCGVNETFKTDDEKAAELKREKANMKIDKKMKKLAEKKKEIVY